MLIISYHNIVRTELDEFDRKLSRLHRDEFAGQMHYLAEEFTPVSLAEMLSMLRQGVTDPKIVAVTFDDGYYGVLAHALPVLQEFRIPATVFVVTDCMRGPAGNQLLHFDELELAFRLTRATSINLDFMGEKAASLHSAHARVDGMKRIKRHLKRVRDARRQKLQRLIIERLEVTPEEIADCAQAQEKFRTLSWEELRGATGAGLTAGSHTCSHRVLDQLDQDEVRYEVCHSFTRLCEEMGSAFLPFAYPYGGAADIGAMSPALIQQAGYDCALTTIPGRNTPAIDKFLLRRVEFEALAWS